MISNSRILLALGASGMLLLPALSGCQGDSTNTSDDNTNLNGVGDDDPDSNTGDDDPVEVEGTSLHGVVRTPAGEPIVGVQVRTSNGLTATTNEDGRFAIQGIGAAQRILVNFQADGYAKTQIPFEIIDGVENTILQTLAPVDYVATFTAAEGLSFQIEENGPTVALPAGGFVDGNGAPYTGTVHVEATFYDVRSPMNSDGTSYEGSEIFAVPGDFSAVDMAGEAQKLESFGMFQVNLTDDGGNELNLAPGQGAPVIMPIFTAEGDERPVLGTTIPAWSYDLAAGLWVEEGIGTVIQLADGRYAWEFTAPHFSTWNCDQPIATHGCITGRITNSQGTPRVGATVRAVGISYTATTTARTDQNGNFCLEVKNGETVWVEISYTVASQPATQRTDPVWIPAGTASCSIQGSPCVDIGTVPVDIMTCVSGVVVNSQGQPLSGVRIQSPQGGTTTTGANGSFCLQVPVFQSTLVYVINDIDEPGFVPIRMYTQPGLPNCQGGCPNIAVLRPYNNVSCASGEVFIGQDPASNTLVEVYDQAFPTVRVFSTLTGQDGSYCVSIPSGAQVSVQVGSGPALCDREVVSTVGWGGEVCDESSQMGECMQVPTLSCNP
jgi:hypothetical protein